jgi:hypothetical protein
VGQPHVLQEDFYILSEYAGLGKVSSGITTIAGHIPAAAMVANANREVDNIGKIMMIDVKARRYRLKRECVKDLWRPLGRSLKRMRVVDLGTGRG